MKLNEIINELRNRLNDNNADNEGEYNDEDLIKYINEALGWFCRVLECVYKTDQTTTNAQQITLDNVIDPYLVIASTGTTNFVCVRKDKRDLDDLYNIDVSGDPRYFYVNQNVVYLFPVVDNVNYNIIVKGFGTETLEDYDDESEVINKHNLIPFLDACEYIARKTRPSVDANLQLIQVAYQSVIQYFNEQGRISNV